MNYVSNVLRTADLLRDGAKDITKFEALQIAVQIQRNELFAQANVLNTGRLVPSALEAIAIELGAAKDGMTIKHALEMIAENIEDTSKNRAFKYPNVGCAQ